MPTTIPAPIDREQDTSTAHPRLPCRGCTHDCELFERCEGALWRITCVATS